LTEHLVFQSRHEGNKKAVDRLGELGGGMFNGMTSWDTTTYFAFVPEQNLRSLLTLFAQLLADPAAGVDESDFEHERQIVANEMRLRTENGTPGQALGWLATQVFSEAHPY